jgi:hypothetical protein
MAAKRQTPRQQGPDAADAVYRQFRAKLVEGEQTIGPLSPMERSMVDAVLEFVKGTIRHPISDAEVNEARERLKKRFPWLYPDPPAWLSPELAECLAEEIRVAERQNPNARHELCAWVRKESGNRPGRRADPQLGEIHRHAAKLFQQGETWGQITIKLCPQRGEGHQCDRGCQDRIRLGAMRFLKAAR